MLVTANIFQPLIDVFESVLKFFHNNVGVSWGFSIVLLTICVRAVLVPLTFRQIKSMVRMQSLAPQIKALQAKYKDDKERQSQEMMKFYRENNVNPLGSCLPLVLQLPVFISLYYMLRKSLRGDICPQVQAAYQAQHHTTGTTPCGPGHGASFLFIPDLTNKASGWVLIVLLALYVGSQLGSTLVMSSAATMEPMQRNLMLFLPLVFVLFVFRFPAGVLVYWITTNFWTMGQQYIVRKRIGPRIAASAPAVDAVVAGGKGGGGSGKGASSPQDRKRGSGAAGELPEKAATGGNGEKLAAAAGLGALFRSRAKPAADAGGNGDGGNGSDAAAATTSQRVAKTKTKSGGRGRGGRSGSGAAKDSSSRKGTDSSDSSSTGGSSTPPPPPRKRKKRSGRRR